MENTPNPNRIENPRSNTYAYLETYASKKENLIKAMRTLGEDMSVIQDTMGELREQIAILSTTESTEDGQLKNTIAELEIELIDQYTTLEKNLKQQREVSKMITQTAEKINEQLQSLKGVKNRHDA